MGNTKYTYAVARIRALEVALFSDAVIEQLLSCKTAAEALQFVVEKGWGDMADQDDPDVVLRREEEKTWEVIKEVAPDASVFNVLSYPKLYHNLKAAIKEVCTEARNPNIFMMTARYREKRCFGSWRTESFRVCRLIWEMLRRKLLKRFFIQETVSCAIL